MNKIKQIILFGIAVLMCSCQSKPMELSTEAVSVPLGGNTYVTAGKRVRRFRPMVSNRGRGRMPSCRRGLKPVSPVI